MIFKKIFSIFTNFYNLKEKIKKIYLEHILIFSLLSLICFKVNKILFQLNFFYLYLSIFLILIFFKPLILKISNKIKKTFYFNLSLYYFLNLKNNIYKNILKINNQKIAYFLIKTLFSNILLNIIFLIIIYNYYNNYNLLIILFLFFLIFLSILNLTEKILIFNMKNLNIWLFWDFDNIQKFLKIKNFGFKKNKIFRFLRNYYLLDLQFKKSIIYYIKKFFINNKEIIKYIVPLFLVNSLSLSFCHDMIEDSFDSSEESFEFENETDEQHDERILDNITQEVGLIMTEIEALLNIDFFENIKRFKPDYVSSFNFDIENYTRNLLGDMVVLTENINKTDIILKNFYLNAKNFGEDFNPITNYHEIGHFTNDFAETLLENQKYIDERIVIYYERHQDTPFILRNLYINNSEIIKKQLEGLMKLSSIDETNKYLASYYYNTQTFLYQGENLIGFINIKNIEKLTFEFKYISEDFKVFSFGNNLSIILDRTGDYLYGVKQNNHFYRPITTIGKGLVKIRGLDGNFMDFRYDNDNIIGIREYEQ